MKAQTISRIPHSLPDEVETSEMIWHHHLELRKIQSGRQSHVPGEKRKREGGHATETEEGR